MSEQGIVNPPEQCPRCGQPVIVNTRYMEDTVLATGMPRIRVPYYAEAVCSTCDWRMHTDDLEVPRETE